MWRGRRFAWVQGRRVRGLKGDGFKPLPPTAAEINGESWSLIAECPRCHACWLATGTGPADFPESYVVYQSSEGPVDAIRSGDHVTMWRGGSPTAAEELVPGLWVHRLGERVLSTVTE